MVMGRPRRCPRSFLAASAAHIRWVIMFLELGDGSEDTKHEAFNTAGGVDAEVQED